MIRYVFKDDPVAFKGAKNADPQKIGEELARLATNAGGDLTPKAVVEAARDPKNLLHPHFEWDDAIAADRYRQDQAREIIRCIRVEDDETEQPERAFLSVAGKGGTSYRTLQDVRSSIDLQKAVLSAAERDLDAFERRYRDMIDVCDLVRSARERVKARRNKIETRAAA